MPASELIQLVPKKYGARRGGTFAMPTVLEAKLLGEAISRSYEEFDRLEVTVGQTVVAFKEREKRHEWQDSVETEREVSDLDRITVWVWEHNSIVSHLGFANNHDAYQFATAAMRGSSVDHIQMEMPRAGKQIDWRKGYNYYWSDWTEVDVSPTAEKISEVSEQKVSGNV